MGSVSLTGGDTTILDTRILADLATTDTVSLDFPNDLAEAKVGKNGNTIYAFNSTGKVVNVTVRVLAGSADDKYINSRHLEFVKDPASFVLFAGEFIKRVGDGAGNISQVIYKVDGGVPVRIPNAKENVEGDTEQSVAVWQIRFANAKRIIG